jgi:hypothetical protein
MKFSGVSPAAGLKSDQFNHQETVPFWCSFIQGIQDSILVPELHLGCVFTKKASASSGLIQNLEPNW